MPDVLVTGLPRSGSATVAALIDYLPNAVSLNMPPGQLGFAQTPLDATNYCKWLAGDFSWTRSQLRNAEPVRDFRGANGAPLLDGRNDPRQVRNAAGDADTVFFTRKLQGDFLLAMRHHTLYTSALPVLAKFNRFKIIAVIRHPVDVLLSWQKLPQPMLAEGRPHGIARFWPEALAVAKADIAPADRLAQLYDLYLQRYHELREHIQIVKYEDVVESPGLISRMFGVETVSAAATMIERRPRIRMENETDGLRDSIRKYGVFTKLYYPDI